MNLLKNLPLKWHGGKFYLAKRIISLMPKHIHYVEPFFGGGQVLLAKQPHGHSEVANDRNGDLMNFWRVLQDDTLIDQMRRILDATPFAQEVFLTAKSSLLRAGLQYHPDLDRETPDAILEPLRRPGWPQYGTLTEMPDTPLAVERGAPGLERAVQFFILARQSRQGLLRGFTNLTKGRLRGDRNEQINSWWSAIDGLQDVHQRIKNVVIFNKNAIDVIKQQDHKDALFYCDPPYVHDTRRDKQAYQKFEMSISEHEDLLHTIRDVRGHVLISGYRCELYDRLLRGWKRTDVAIKNHASSKSTKETMTESIWQKPLAVKVIA